MVFVIYFNFNLAWNMAGIKMVENKKNNSHTSLFFTEKNTRWLAIITVLLGIISLIAIQFHPTMMIFRKILFTILLGL